MGEPPIPPRSMYWTSPARWQGPGSPGELSNAHVQAGAIDQRARCAPDSARGKQERGGGGGGARARKARPGDRPRGHNSAALCVVARGGGSKTTAEPDTHLQAPSARRQSRSGSTGARPQLAPVPWAHGGPQCPEKVGGRRRMRCRHRAFLACGVKLRTSAYGGARPARRVCGRRRAVVSRPPTATHTHTEPVAPAQRCVSRDAWMTRVSHPGARGAAGEAATSLAWRARLWRATPRPPRPPTLHVCSHTAYGRGGCARHCLLVRAGGRGRPRTRGVHEGVCIRDTRGVRRVRECVWVALRPARAARVPRAPRGPHCLTLIAREARTRSVLEAVHSRGPCGVRRVRECARVARAPRAGLRTSISQVRAA